MIDGKNVVVTGKIAGESRATAEAKLVDAGAKVQSAVNGTTDVLVVGANVGAKKMNAARDRGIAIVAWEDVFKDGEPPSGGSTPELDEQLLERARTVAPMLAKKADEVPTGEGWLFEVKWDGVRCVATVKDGRVSMQSRSAKSEYMERWPGVAEALSKLPDCVLDGELVVFDDNGDSSFESIGGEGRQAYVVFDVLEYVNPIHGYQDVRDRTLEQRRGLLEWMGIEDGPIAISPAFTDGEELLAVAAGKKLEGIVAKRASSPYREGTRTDAWLKLKLRCSQEFVVIGWKPGQGEMAGAAGSLLLAVNDQGVLSYCGRVGAGPTYVEAKAFMDLAPIERAKLRLDLHNAPAPELRDVVWVKPELVVQVRFQRWTEDGRLWHPTIAGVRTDKQAGEVVREA